MKKNKKKIIIIIILIFLIIIGLLATVNLLKNKNKENITIKDDLENIEFTYSEFGPGFVCSNKEIYNNTYSYDKGSFVYCEVAYEMPADRKGIKEIWFENTYDEELEYLEIVDLYEGWKLSTDNEIIQLITDKESTYGDGAYKIKFRIKPSTQKEKMEILFKNIRYKDAEGKYYKTDDSKIELMINTTTKYKYEESELNDSISFYQFNEKQGYELINKYDCKDESCHLFIAQCFGHVDLENGITFIYDNDRVLMYDFNVGVIGEFDESISELYDKDDYNTKYFVVKNIKMNKFGIIDLKGNIVKEFKSDGYGINNFCELYDDSYSLKYNMIVEKQNDKYGISSITKDEVIVDHKYEEIRLYDDKYYKVKENNLWYLHSFETNEKILDEGYKELFFAKDNIIVTQIDNYLYIKDYEGKNLIEDKIEVFIEYDEDACCGGNPGIYVAAEKDIIRIITYSETDKDYGYDSYVYEFNIKTNELIKKDSAN